MPNINDIFIADQRLVILRVLAKAPGYSCNDSIIDDVLETYSHNISRDKVRTHIRWLEEQELLTVEKIGERTLVATITQRGMDVARGHAFVDGVKRPSPGE